MSDEAALPPEATWPSSRPNANRASAKALVARSAQSGLRLDVAAGKSGLGTRVQALRRGPRFLLPRLAASAIEHVTEIEPGEGGSDRNRPHSLVASLAASRISAGTHGCGPHLSRTAPGWVAAPNRRAGVGPRLRAEASCRRLTPGEVAHPDLRPASQPSRLTGDDRP